MEGGGKEMALADGDRRAVQRDERFDGRTGRHNSRGADERERNGRPVRQRRLGVKAPELASVGVPFDRDVEEAEWFAENADAYCHVLLLANAHGAPLQQVGKKSVEDFLSIRKAMGLSVDPTQKLYNTSKFNGYTMKKTGK